MRKVDDFFSGKPEMPLFHYTGISGFMGIVESTSLWASHAYYLNDSNEITYASRVLKQVIDRYITETYTKVDPKHDMYIEETEETVFLRQFSDWVKIFEHHQYYIFVFSMSEEGNLLSQWRSYTPHGKGVSIGMTPDMLSETAEKNNLRLVKCLYDDNEHEDIMHSLLNKIFITFRQRLEKNTLDTDGKHPTQKYHKFLDEFRGDVLQVLAIIKHSAFREEKEWRLISKHYDHNTDNAILFREGASLLVPYIRIDIFKPTSDKAIFNQIYLGPTQHDNLSMSSLTAYLSMHGVSNVTINSLIPYREW